MFIQNYIDYSTRTTPTFLNFPQCAQSHSMQALLHAPPITLRHDQTVGRHNAPNSIGTKWRPTAINATHSTATPKRTHFYHFNDGRMAVSPHTRVLQTKVRYQKKRKTMVFPPVCHTAVKLYHGDHQDGTGIFPTETGIFPNKKNGDN